MNKTKQYLESRENILSIYFTSEYPQKNTTQEIIKSLSDSGVDMIEIGMPFSDPLADGPVIQHSSKIALENGFTIDQMFSDIKAVHKEAQSPLVLMGYFNMVMAYGMERFLKQCKEVAIDAVILPDLPPEIYEERYKDLFETYGVSLVFLITPQTSTERLNYINKLSKSFIYAVADNSITGTKEGFSDNQLAYFERLRKHNFDVPVVIGFGISDKQSYTEACKYANGVIIGSAFIKAIEQSKILSATVPKFIESIRELPN